MAELLVRVVDKVNTDDPLLDVKCLKRGDVVVVCEDGHPWGHEELANPDWRILHVPDMTVSEASAWLSPERRSHPSENEHMLRRRAFAIDLDHHALSEHRPFLQDHRRRNARHVVAAEAVRTAKHAKAKLEDPTIIGPPAGEL